MNFDFLNSFIIVLLTVIAVEYLTKKNKSLFLLVFFCLAFFIVVSEKLFETEYFVLEEWKWFFIYLISGFYVVVINLLEKKNFDIIILVSLVYIGSTLLIISDNLLSLYLGLELQTFSVFILVAKNRYSIKSSEAGLKYFILGAISSGIFLLAITLNFLFGFSLNIKDLVLVSNEIIINFSFALIIISLCFKLSLFPLHFWIPDVYEGSSWDVISLISILPKISVIAVFIQIVIPSNLILIASLGSIIIGTLGSLNQTKVKRLLGYSGIAHMGFVALGFNLVNSSGYIVSSLYLTIYMLTMISLFIIIIVCINLPEYIIELGHFKFINKLNSITITLIILSIAGIPPLSGFLSKWYLLWNSINENYLVVSFIMILFSAIAAGYYLRVVKISYFQKKSSFFLWKDLLIKDKKKDELSLVFLGFLFFFSCFLIINFSFMVDIINLMFFKCMF